jgi:hypothetical protein
LLQNEQEVSLGEFVHGCEVPLLSNNILAEMNAIAFLACILLKIM